MTGPQQAPPSPHRTGAPAPRAAKGLGLFSLGLGSAQALAPDRLARLVGVEATEGTQALVRLLGLRELTSGAGIFASRRVAPWLWARVAGDGMDLALLSRAALQNRDPRKALAALAAVAGVTVADVLAAAKQTGRGADQPGAADEPYPSSEGGRERSATGTVAHTAVTVQAPADDLYARWRRFEDLPTFMLHLQSVTETGDGRSRWVAKKPGGGTVEWDAEVTEDRPGEVIAWRSVAGADVDNSGEVRFVPAPQGRGTEVHVRLSYQVPFGRVGSLVARLLGEEPQQQVKDDLRRFKQVVETGEVVRSEGTPKGSNTQAQRQQHPAQPHAGSPEPATKKPKHSAQSR